ncbi:MAG TPA: exodeoxyribonuclease VII small subunit [Thermodesulfobacteriota bacterium]|nr:exodeoxyribonuclease VII small subunit [Thermodesulfobacteriota bacterium]
MAEKFEDAMKKLEGIVERMEKGDMFLNESLKLFEEGVKLTRFCSQELQKAEKRVELLTKNIEGKLVAVPFEEETDEA